MNVGFGNGVCIIYYNNILVDKQCWCGLVVVFHEIFIKVLPIGNFVCNECTYANQGIVGTDRFMLLYLK